MNSVQLIQRLLLDIGENPDRPGLKETPARVVKSWGEIYAGYHADVAKLFKVFEEPCDELVLLKNIEFYSTCEHHMQPIVGKAHIAYIPNKKVIGISKLARVLDAYARRLQIQERIGKQVVEALDTYLKPLGSACVIQAKHFCMCARGVNKQNSEMVTSALTGAFRKDKGARAELMSMIGAGLG